MFKKDRCDQENNEDVVVESQSVADESGTRGMKSAPVERSVPEAVPAAPKLIRMVPGICLSLGVEVAVFITHLESCKRIWVCREEDEVRVSLLMDKLARMEEELKPSQRMKKGAVYGARFSQDEEMYRVVLKDREEGRYVVQFIDFGNMETKEEKELYDIPEDIGSCPAAAVMVDVLTELEDTSESRSLVEDLLEGEDVTVTVLEDGAVFHVDGQEVKFCQPTRRNINSLVTSEELMTMDEMSNTFERTLPEKQEHPSVVPSPAVETNLPTAGSASSSISPEELVTRSPVGKASPVPIPTTVVPQPIIPPTVPKPIIPSTEVSQPIILPTVVPQPIILPIAVPQPILPNAVHQPIPTRTFAKAISALQSQLLVRPRSSNSENDQKDGKKPDQFKATKDDKACQWKVGDKVVARWPDGVWRQATIVEVDTTAGQAKVASEGVDEAMVSLLSVRPSSLPVEALNLIDQGLVSNKIVRKKGDGATSEKRQVVPAVGKVKEWMDNNMAQLSLGGGDTNDTEVDLLSPTLDTSKHSMEQIPLPPSQDLSAYCKTGKGSLHIQSVLNSSNPKQSNLVLSAFLTGSPGPFSLMTSPKSSYCIQKLITVLPSSQLQPLLSVILSNFTQLSMDSSGCRVVQSMLEFSSPDQQRSITSLLCNAKTLLVLAADRHGTYVAQACLPHLTPSPTSLLALVNCLLGYTATLGQHQFGTFFLQRLVGVLSTHYPGSGAACLLQEDILSSLPQLVTTEAGSRLVQAMLKDTQPNTLVRVAKWIEENKQGVIVTKPAMFVGVSVFEQIIQRLGEEGSWTSLLDRLVRAFLDQDKNSSNRQSLLISAAVHPVGHVLAREVVSVVNHLEESTKNAVMRVLASEVDQLCVNKFGAIVLKGLAESAI
eukprot:GFUD01044962.1.p1 GENE.GFUD01044962.1~~GFUD01044962.1.p1  ORF type:complete len:886 (+),score=254.50 GFUD01044962.1:3-2660(+)